MLLPVLQWSLTPLFHYQNGVFLGTTITLIYSPDIASEGATFDTYTLFSGLRKQPEKIIKCKLFSSLLLSALQWIFVIYRRILCPP